MESDHNYWLVGAMWGGSRDQADAFYRRGYWEMGWDDDDQPNYAEKREQMKAGDRIAIKALRGRGASTITIKALGIVKDVHDEKVYVDWLLTDLDREVESKGCFGTLHGPYGTGREPEWVRHVFHI